MRQVITRWGKATIKVRRWQCAACDSYGHSNPSGMDGSGLSPLVLKSVVYLGSHLSYRESQEALNLQGVVLSLGQCEGREIKQAVLFPLNHLEQRHYIAHAGEVEQFAPLVHGLPRHLGMRQNDVLIGIADGAPWLDHLFENLGVDVRILDVFHATEYLDKVMQALGWEEDKRTAHRASWYRADINARVWLRHYLPDPTVWCTWSESARTALRYLEERLDQMDYYDFNQRGYPLGSGVIEDAANSVIAARMRRSGMRWSYSGINRIATLRAEFASAQPILDFTQVRLLAFP